MNLEKDEIRIGISKSKALLMITIAMGLLVVLIWALLKVIMLPDAFNRTFLIICISPLIFTFSLGCYIGLTNLFDKRKCLIVNNNGIQINIGIDCEQFVLWNEILGLKKYDSKGGPMFLLIFIKNPKSYIEKFRGLNRFLLKMSNFNHKTPVILASNWLDCSFEELVSLIEDKYKKHN